MSPRRIKTNTKNWLGFFFIGLINNFTYVVFLSASEDLVKNQSGLVLFCNIFPSFLAKLLVPYVQHLFSYRIRVCLVVSTFVSSLLLVSLSKTLGIQLLGIVIAAFGSGVGESTFLAMSTFYESDVLSGWSSGTGGAGITGSLYYLLMTSVARVKVEKTLLISLLFPSIMLICYFFIISHPYKEIENSRLLNQTKSSKKNNSITKDCGTSGEELVGMNSSEDYQQDARAEDLSFKGKIKLVNPLLIRFMIPLFVVYSAEYTINQGISPVIIHEQNKTPLANLRDQYIYYQFLYQIGVFISRSSVAFLKIDHFWITSVLQVVVLAVLLLRSLLVYSTSIYVIFAIILVEGLLGGACYANAYRVLTNRIHPSKREFSIGAVGIADSLGITCASIASIFIQPALCNYQVSRGVSLCKL